ncbi:hypothetical protein AAL_01773 [Moelleriella libera RCEF 2490]|uniref:Uncharacterized protein n=1 Tax=Moelleriella libera RCEF 2490 TaxID=1081109 RepID=A0A166UFI1_9HYPO|nr:hypothetical protein AAL_01773 [Moelleriella libera RCEF 2490]
MKIKREDDADQDQKPRIGIVADVSASARRALELEKQRYPGASAWAPDEEHLFKTLFQRAERPLLPAHWDVDLRGIPVQDSIFAAEGADADAAAGGAVVYSRSGKDYQATAALLRLIDLTSSVRATVQSGQRHKAPRVILAALQRYVRWAAWDAGHAGRRIVPNMLVAAAAAAAAGLREDHHHHHYAAAEEEEAAITAGMERRMRALARRQRDFFASSPHGTAQQEQHRRQHQQEQEQEQEQEEQKEEKKGGGCRSQPQLPVVYGLFVLNCSVVLLSVDSAKGDDAYVSFHVAMDLEDRHQSVWNALTVAVAVCLARNQLVRVVDAFEELPAAAS